MTFVAARRFGDRIILVGDTKIGHRGGVGRFDRDTTHAKDRADYANNYVPGRLKVFPVSPTMSLGYAGCADVALGIVRRAAASGDCSGDPDQLIERLRRETMDDRVDFIVVSHHAEPSIVKIARGNRSADQAQHWIGDPDIVPLLSACVDKQQRIYDSATDLPGWITGDLLAEMAFTGGWTNLLLRAPSLTEAVGGFPVAVLASPQGHCFQMSAGAYNADSSIRGDGIWLDVNGKEVEQFYGQYGFSPIVGEGSGAPVLGVWLEQLSLGYIYDPLMRNEAECHARTTMQAFQMTVAHRSVVSRGAAAGR